MDPNDRTSLYVKRSCGDLGCNLHLFGSTGDLVNVKNLPNSSTVMVTNSDENATLIVDKTGELRILDDEDQ